MSDSDDHTVEGALDDAAEAVDPSAPAPIDPELVLDDDLTRPGLPLADDDEHDVTIAAPSLLASAEPELPAEPPLQEPPAAPDVGHGAPEDGDIEADPTPPTPATVAAAASAPTPPVDPAAAAAAFVAEARAANAANVTATQSDNEPAPSRRWLVIALAVLIGAQIVAGGTWLALRALDDEVAEPTPTPVPTLAPLAPTALPTTNAGPTAIPTATPIPPTPVWELRADGPSVAPFTWIVEAIVSEPTFFESRDGAAIDPSADLPTAISNPLPSGEPLILRVAAGQPDQEWAQVLLPGEAGSDAWIRSDEFVWRSTNRMIEVDIATNLLTLFEGNSALLIVPVASGRRGDPTQPVSSYVFSEPTFEGRRSLFHLAAFDDLPLDHHGLPTMRIELTDDRSTVGDYVTGGQVVVANDRVEDMLRLIEPGARVEIIGTPPRPTPTPVPTPTPRPTPTRSPLGPSGSGCPPGAGGTAPNCYRVVERTTLAGQCPGRQVVIQGNCMIFAGDPETPPGGGGTRCPETAPQLLEGRCYTNIGPIPIEDGPCPDDATEVSNECRIPISQ